MGFTRSISARLAGLNMLVIFDCDGVLVDSEPLAAKVFSEHLQNYGVFLSGAECERKFRGHTMDYCLRLLEAEYPATLPHDFLDSLAWATQEAFAKDLQSVPDVEPVLQWLQARGTSFCVASNGALGKIHHSLSVTGLRAYFGDHCFSAEQVGQGKPAPDLFLLAAQTMGVSARETLVVEDSVAGVTAAIRAKMTVLRYGEPLQIGSSSVPSFTEMASLPQLIQEMI